MVGTTLGAYRIDQEIGHGGMGWVYRAHDIALNRDVALKVLPESLAADAERLTRFRREAQALAALNHPNIVTVHAVEEPDGIHFIAMEVVEGRHLGHRRRTPWLIPGSSSPVCRRYS